MARKAPLTLVRMVKTCAPVASLTSFSLAVQLPQPKDVELELVDFLVRPILSGQSQRVLP